MDKLSHHVNNSNPILAYSEINFDLVANLRPGLGYGPGWEFEH
jgi:hypothetical protein